MDSGVADTVTPATLAGSTTTPRGEPAIPVACSLDSVAPSLDKPSISGVGCFLKRGMDIVLGCLLILVMSPLLFGVAVGIKVTSRGPVFFWQDRRGRDGVIFRCMKFRTMYHHHADPDCSEQTRHNDPRVTFIGRMLRRHSIDELPQLFNVVMGDMALVGPRPHALGTNLNGKLLHEISPDYFRRYQMRPGITGWAQVNGWRGILDTEAKLDERLKHDLHYIYHWSIWMDCKILLMTFTCLVDNERAF